MEGRIKFYKREKKFGFLAPNTSMIGHSGEEIFFHLDNCLKGYNPIEGDNVSFELGQGKDGRTMAVRIQLLKIGFEICILSSQMADENYNSLTQQIIKSILFYEIGSVNHVTDSVLTQSDIFLIIVTKDLIQSKFFSEIFPVLLNLKDQGLANIFFVSYPDQNSAIMELNVENNQHLKGKTEPQIIDLVIKKIQIIKAAKKIYRTKYYHKVLEIIEKEKKEKSGILNLSNLALNNIPDVIFRMLWLEELILSVQTDIDKFTGEKNENNSELNRNYFSSIPPGFKKMKNLKSLSINGNFNIRNKISDLGGLKSHLSIESLNLSYCEFSSLKEIENLPMLKFLALSGNAVYKIDIDPDKFKNLKVLNLENNLIEKIDDEESFLALLDQLEYINLKNNPINLEWLNPSILEASGDNKDEILKFLTLSLKGLLNRVDTLPQKIILLGNSEAGKTELAKVLIKDKGQFLDKGTTHGLKIRKWNLGEKYNDKSIYIYDFGGQDFYHSVYNMFFTYDTIYIIIWDDKNIENHSFISESSKDVFIKYNPNYWLRNIKYFIDRDKLQNTIQHIEVISLHNNFKSHNDFQHLSIDMKGLNHHFTLNLKENIDALKKIKLDLLKQSIFEISNNFDNKFSLSQSDLDIFNHVLKIFNQDIYKKYTLEEFYSEFGKPSYGGFLLVMHQKGLVFHLHQHDDLKDYIWINPSTISNKIYEILDKTSLLDKGELLESTFDKEINKDSELKTLLLHQEVIFRDDSDFDPKIIVPQFLPLSPQNDLLFELATEGMETLFALRFKDFMPHGLMSRLMCRLGKNPGKKILKRYEFICRLCVSEPNKLNNVETVKVKVFCDMVKLKMHIQATFKPEHKINKADLQEYLFKVVISAYWNFKHLEYYETPWRVENNFIIYLDPVWDPDQFYRHTNFDFEISVDNNVWVDYGLELSNANSPKDPRINPIINAKKYFMDSHYIEIDDDINYSNLGKEIDEVEPTDEVFSNESQYEYYESFEKMQLSASLFNPFIENEVKTPKKVFVSYAHADSEHRITLQKYLINLQREHLIEIWHDGLINPGDDWDEKIITSIEEADIVILLVSQNFIASSYIYNTEMPKALKKVLAKDGVIFPFILENCDWKKWQILVPNENEGNLIDVGKYQGMPVNKDTNLLTPLENTAWRAKSDAWMVLVEKMRGFCIGTN